jgi:pyruvate kinase
MLDTKGPEIRTGFLKEGIKEAKITKGDVVEISKSCLVMILICL